MSDLPFSDLQGLFEHSSESSLNAPAQSIQQFLRLRLTSKIPVLLPVQQLTEVLDVPEHQIMPIPHLPAWVMGVYNWRGEILWMIDLGHLCGLPPWHEHPLRRSVHSAVILNLTNLFTDSMNTTLPKGQLLGLIVGQVEDIEWCNLSAVQPLDSTMITPSLAPFSAGCWQKSDHEILAILDGVAILSAMPQ